MASNTKTHAYNKGDKSKLKVEFIEIALKHFLDNKDKPRYDGMKLNKLFNEHVNGAGDVSIYMEDAIKELNDENVIEIIEKEPYPDNIKADLVKVEKVLKLGWEKYKKKKQEEKQEDERIERELKKVNLENAKNFKLRSNMTLAITLAGLIGTSLIGLRLNDSYVIAPYIVIPFAFVAVAGVFVWQKYFSKKS